MKRIKWMPAIVFSVLFLSAFVSPPSYGQVPSNPYKGNSTSAIDIDVTYISRTPRYDYDATKNTPAVGDAVTFTAHVRSRGTSATGNFAFKWYIDGVEKSSGSHLHRVRVRNNIRSLLHLAGRTSCDLLLC